MEAIEHGIRRRGRGGKLWMSPFLLESVHIGEGSLVNLVYTPIRFLEISRA